jgi:very-short-patch-repair endonuclease
VVDLAVGQKGLVARRQLLGLRLSAGTIDEWVAAGHLHVVYPGVYLVGHPVMAEGGRELAAVLASGPDSVLSHRSAAEVWKLIDLRRGLALQTTSPHRRIEGPRGIYVHSSIVLSQDEIDERNGIPITSAARTIFDFASQAAPWEVAKAYEEGLIQNYFTRDHMIVMAMRLKGRRGIRKVRELIDRDAPPSVTIEEAHRRLLELVRTSDLPHPRTEVKIDGKPVDILWGEAKLVVEMDGGAFHNTPSRAERDKLRDSELAAIGYLVIRVTWKELSKRPLALISRISQTYALRRSQPSNSR